MTQSPSSNKASGVSTLCLLLLSLASRVEADAYITKNTQPRALRSSIAADTATEQHHELIASHERHHAAPNLRSSKAAGKPTKLDVKSAGTAEVNSALGKSQKSSQLRSGSSSATKGVTEKAQNSPKWVPPRQNRTTATSSNSTLKSAVVGPRSQVILKKLCGGHQCDSRMQKLDQAFVLKLLQGGGIDKFAAHKRHQAHKHHQSHKTANTKAQNQSVAIVMIKQVQQKAIECYVGIRVSLKMDKDLRCPERCPLMVKDKFTAGTFCDFKCVGATTEDCRAANPKTSVPDLEKGVCRACNVNGCESCLHGGSDKCLNCASGYALVDGHCVSSLAWVKYGCFGLLGLLILFVLAWVVTIYNRPITNAATLLHALETRSRTKLHQPLHLPEDENGVDGAPTADGRPRKLWPLSTNLCTTNVAGPGLALHFNFQVALIVWATVLALAWLALGLHVDYPTLFQLGTRRARSEWENCWIVQWGYDAQSRLMWTKVGFLVFVYVFTFIGSILFGIYQLRCFDYFDQANTTHKDFCAKITGLPRLIGSVLAEEEIGNAIAEACNQRVIGVSVCWDMADTEELLMQVLESDMDKRDTELHGQALPSAEPLRNGLLARFFGGIEAAFLSPTTQKILTKNSRHKTLQPRHASKATRADPKDEETGHVLVVDPILELHKLQTTSQAFVVFETEVARNAAVETMSDGVEFRGMTLKVEEATCEPDSIMWGHMHNECSWHKAKDIVWGICMILLALLVWTVVFYLPYVWIALGSNYANGQEPDALASFTFGMVVCAGNALMYVVCGEVADRIQFNHVDSRELCYMGLYLFACIVNVAMDMICAYYVAFYAMVGEGMKTYDGTPLADVDNFTDRFETYAMQREIGRTLLGYTMPSTALIPFLIEPIVTIYVPWKIMVALVRTKPEIQGITAESYLKPLVMDMARYADLLLNVMLAVLILFFPGGFNLTMFGGLAISHIYVYAFDHYRVLRCITACDFASMNIDWWAQWFMCIPCGVVLMCYIFKSNCEGVAVKDKMRSTSYFCDQSSGLVFKCFLALIGHVILHTVVLVFLVPCFRRKQDDPSEEHYEHCARRIPISWFSGNPINCLRSQFIYDHVPPCDFSVIGKQHLVRLNPSIGCYFSEREAETEDYTETASINELRLLSSRKAVDAVTSLTSRLHRSSAASKDEPKDRLEKPADK